MVIGQGEDFHCLDHAHFGGGFICLDAIPDKLLHFLPENVVVVKCGQFDGVFGRLGELVGLAVNEENAQGFFRALGQKLGDADLQGFGDVFQLGDGGVSLDAGEEVAGRGAHPVGDVGQGEALPAADFFEVCFNALHTFVFFFCEGRDLLGY